MPGWIDPLSGWGTAAGRGQARDNDETSDPLTPQLDVVYAFDPDSMMYQELWGYGITAAGVAASNNNVLGGSAAVFKAHGRTTEAMCVKANAAMKFFPTTPACGKLKKKISISFTEILGSINFGVGGNQRLFLLSIKKET